MVVDDGNGFRKLCDKRLCTIETHVETLGISGITPTDRAVKVTTCRTVGRTVMSGGGCPIRWRDYRVGKYQTPISCGHILV